MISSTDREGRPDGGGIDGGRGGREAAGAAFPEAKPIAVGSLGLGLLAQLLFFDVGLGINFPMAVAALLLAAWLAGGPLLRRLRPADAWLPLAALIFAACVALRGDRTLVALDVLGSLALTAASVSAFGGLRVVDRSLGGRPRTRCRQPWTGPRCRRSSG